MPTTRAPGPRPWRTISTTKTTTAAQPPVTKPIHETKLEIVTKPFVSTSEETVAPSNTRHATPQESPAASITLRPSAGSRQCHTAKGAGRSPKVVVHENFVRCSVNLEIGREEIEVLDAGGPGGQALFGATGP